MFQIQNKLNHLIFKEQIEDSTLFGEQYHEMFSEQTATPINNPLIDNLIALSNSIISSYKLTNFQKQILKNLFEGFIYIQQQIDPTRLNFNNFYNIEDEELLLYRESSKGLINIIIHNEESFAFSYIDNNNKNKDQLTFYDLSQDIDFEKIALDFFAG